MADRGDVLRLKRRLGFGARGEGESVLVVQEDELGRVLPTILVVPLDPAIAAHGGRPIAVRVSAQEAGASVDQVALVHQVRPVAKTALAPGVVGTVLPRTMAAIDRALRYVLSLG
ncbi:MAG: type II toxin-antitoxin system PemK/MazF family toxin [Deltaproteobacteria bacterium]|nr:type II toxin-antitoxin system PemK/MazF family toxin [Deltaproteobacteria bacterium]